MLRRDRLRDKLREFHDPDFASFRGFPPSKTAARKEWAAAIDDYIGVAEEDVPRTPAMADKHTSLLMTNVKTAFEGRLALADTISASAAAADFAGAWKSAIEAITPGPPVTDTTSATYLFISFTNIPAKHATLTSSLQSLFEAPSASTVPRLTEIADAFHAATGGLEYQATKMVGTTSSTETVGVK